MKVEIEPIASGGYIFEQDCENAIREGFRQMEI